jgi:hypothetical protein
VVLANSASQVHQRIVIALVRLKRIALRTPKVLAAQFLPTALASASVTVDGLEAIAHNVQNAMTRLQIAQIVHPVFKVNLDFRIVFEPVISMPTALVTRLLSLALGIQLATVSVLVNGNQILHLLQLNVRSVTLQNTTLKPAPNVFLD